MYDLDLWGLHPLIPIDSKPIRRGEDTTDRGICQINLVARIEPNGTNAQIIASEFETRVLPLRH